MHQASFICPPWNSQAGFVWPQLSPISLAGAFGALVSEATDSWNCGPGRTPAADGRPSVWRHPSGGVGARTSCFSLAKFLLGKEAPPAFSSSCSRRALCFSPRDCASGTGLWLCSSPWPGCLGGGAWRIRGASVRTFDSARSGESAGPGERAS